MEKTRFKLNICGVDVTVSGDVDRDGAEAIAERVRVRMEEVLNNAYGATIEKAAVIAAMNLSEELSRTEAALNQAREEADALRTKTKEFAGADGLKARLSEAEMKLGVLQEKLRLAENRAEAAEKEAEEAKAAAQNAAHTAAAEPLDLPLIDLRMVSLVEDAEGNLVAVGIAMPSLSKALQKAKGKMLPFGWYHLLKALFIKRPRVLDLLLVGVKPEYQSKGVNALLFYDLVPIFQQMGFEYGESNPELELNKKVQAQWSAFESVQHKRRRAYKKMI